MLLNIRSAFATCISNHKGERDGVCSNLLYAYFIEATLTVITSAPTVSNFSWLPPVNEELNDHVRPCRRILCQAQSETWNRMLLSHHVVVAKSLGIPFALVSPEKRYNISDGKKGSNNMIDMGCVNARSTPTCSELFSDNSNYGEKKVRAICAWITWKMRSQNITFRCR